MSVAYTNQTMTAVRQGGPGSPATAGAPPAVSGPTPQFDVNQFLQGLLGAFGQGFGQGGAWQFPAQPQPAPGAQAPAMPALPAWPPQPAVAPLRAAPGPAAVAPRAGAGTPGLQNLAQAVDAAVMQAQQPVRGTIRLDRWEDRRDHGFMGDKPNRSSTKSQNFTTPGFYDYPRLVEVPAGVRLYGFHNENYQGQLKVLGPGRHKTIVQSGVLMPDVDIDSLINSARMELSIAASNCDVTAANWRQLPLVTKLGQLFDAMTRRAMGTPVAQMLFDRKRQTLQELGQQVQQYAQGCRAQAQRPPQAAPPQQAQQQAPQQAQQAACATNQFFRGKCIPQSALPCPSGRFNAAVDRTGTPYLDEGTGEYRIWCMRGPRTQQVVTRIGPNLLMRQPAITPYGSVGARRQLPRGAWRNGRM